MQTHSSRIHCMTEKLAKIQPVKVEDAVILDRTEMNMMR